jgi:hypothetical protein
MKSLKEHIAEGNNVFFTSATSLLGFNISKCHLNSTAQVLVHQLEELVVEVTAMADDDFSFSLDKNSSMTSICQNEKTEHQVTKLLPCEMMFIFCIFYLFKMFPWTLKKQINIVHL